MAAVDPKFIIELQGKDFVTFEGLLDLGHQEGLSHIFTEIVQVPAEENKNTAIIRALVKVKKGEFSGYGDASPASVGRNIAPHIIRMAETRAVARALRFAVNIGMTAVEELGEDDKSAKQLEVNELTNYTAELNKNKLTSGTISDAQQKRMFAISKGNAEIAKRVLVKYGYTSSKEVKRSDYEKICTEIETAVKAG